MSSIVPARALPAEQQGLTAPVNAALVDRHRPQRFDEVRGQESAVDYLSGLILRGQICRNILLYGSVGSGKTSLARIYAKALNCENPSSMDGSPCLSCGSCRSIEDGAFTELDAPSFRKLDDLDQRITSLLQLERSEE